MAVTTVTLQANDPTLGADFAAALVAGNIVAFASGFNTTITLGSAVAAGTGAIIDTTAATGVTIAGAAITINSGLTLDVKTNNNASITAPIVDNGHLIVDGNTSAATSVTNTIGGGISGSGDLVVNGIANDHFQLLGITSYSGGTTVSGAELFGTAQNIHGNINLVGTGEVSVNAVANDVLNVNVTGNGTLIKAGAGSDVVHGSVNLASPGGITILDGRLDFRSASLSANVNMGTNGDATLAASSTQLAGHTISLFNPGDALDLADVRFGVDNVAATSSQINVTVGGAAQTIAAPSNGLNTPGAKLQLTNDGSGGTLLQIAAMKLGAPNSETVNGTTATSLVPVPLIDSFAGATTETVRVSYSGAGTLSLGSGSVSGAPAVNVTVSARYLAFTGTLPQVIADLNAINVTPIGSDFGNLTFVANDNVGATTSATTVLQMIPAAIGGTFQTVSVATAGSAGSFDSAVGLLAADSGTLSIVAGLAGSVIATGATPLTLPAGTTLLTNNAGIYSVNGTIAAGNTNGSGLIKSGIGTLVLTGNDPNLGGPLLVKAGALDVSAVTGMTNLKVALAASGTQLAAASSETSAVSPAVTLTEVTAGSTIDLTALIGTPGVASYAAGKIQLDASDFVTVSQAGASQAGLVDIDAAAVNDTGTGKLISINATAVASNSTVVSGAVFNGSTAITLGANDFLMLSEATGVAEPLGGAISGTGTLIQNGPGTISLNGSLAGFTGTIDIAGGSVYLKTTPGSQTVNANFAGASSSELSIGNLANTTTLHGNLSGLAIGSTLEANSISDIVIIDHGDQINANLQGPGRFQFGIGSGSFTTINGSLAGLTVSSVLTVLAGDHAAFTHTGSDTFLGTLSGAGPITIDGGDQLTFAAGAIDSFIGPTFINTATLDLSPDVVGNFVAHPIFNLAGSAAKLIVNTAEASAINITQLSLGAQIQVTNTTASNVAGIPGIPSSPPPIEVLSVNGSTTTIAINQTNLFGAHFNATQVNADALLAVQALATVHSGGNVANVTYSSAANDGLFASTTADLLGIATGAISLEVAESTPSIVEVIGANISGNGTLAQNGPGTLKLTGALTLFTGALQLNAGTLDLTAEQSLGSNPAALSLNTNPSVLVTVAAQAQALNNETIFGFHAGDKLILTGAPGPNASLTTANTTVAIDTTTDPNNGIVTVSVAGALASTFYLSHAGGIVQPLQNDGFFTGAVDLNFAQPLQVTNTLPGQVGSLDNQAAALGGAAGLLTINLPNNSVITSGANLPFGASILTPGPNTNAYTIAGVLSGSGFIKDGGGALALPTPEALTTGAIVTIAGGSLDITGSGLTRFDMTGGKHAALRGTSTALANDTLGGFTLGDGIDVANFVNPSKTTAAIVNTTDLLITDNLTSQTVTVKNAAIGNATFAAVSDEHGGTLVVPTIQVSGLTDTPSTSNLRDAVTAINAIANTPGGIAIEFGGQVTTSGAAAPFIGNGIVTLDSALALPTQPVLLDTAGNAVTITGAGALTGTDDLVKAGHGKLTLAAANPGLLGTITIGGGTLELQAAIGTGSTAIDMINQNVTLAGPHTVIFGIASIKDVQLGSALDLTDANPASITASYDNTSHFLTITSTDANNPFIHPVLLVNSASGLTPTVAADGNGGTNIFASPAAGSTVTPPPAGGGSFPHTTIGNPVLLSGGTSGSPIVVALGPGIGSTELNLPGSGPGSPIDLRFVNFTAGGATTPVVLFDTTGNANVTLPNTLPDNNQPLEFVATVGNNSITGGSARAAIFGGTGNDTLSFTSGGGTIVGGVGHATINGGSAGTGFNDPNKVIIFGATLGGDYKAGGSGSIVVGGGGSETLRGGVGLDAAGGQQLLVAGNGTDSIGGDSINGVAGATMFALAGAGTTNVAAGKETDIIVGGAGNLVVNGMASGGGPLSVVGAGSTGGTPLTNVMVNGASSAIVFDNTVAGGHGTLSVTGGAGALTVLGFSSVTSGMTVAGGTGSTVIVADGGADQLALGAGGGSIFGGAGLDTMVAGAGGTSLLVAGTGADTFRIAPGSATTVSIVGFRPGVDHLDLLAVGFGGSQQPVSTTGSFSVAGFAAVPTIDWDLGNGEKLQLIGPPAITANDFAISVIPGTASDDSLTGTAAPDSISGGGGHDSISAGGGNDIIDISIGASTPGSDSVDAGAGNDVIRSSPAVLAASPTIDGGAGTDTLEFLSAATVNPTYFTNVTNVENIQFDANMGSPLAVVDTLVAAQGGSVTFLAMPGSLAQLNLDLSGVLAGNSSVTVLGDNLNAAVVFSGAADTVTLGGGHESIDLGAGNDMIVVTAGALLAGQVTLSGGFNVNFGGDQLSLTGGGSFTIGPNVTHFETIDLGSNINSIFTLSDGFVTSADPINGAAVGGLVNVSIPAGTLNLGTTLIVDASAVSAAGRVSVNAHSRNGTVTLLGGAGNDTLIGGNNADSIVGGPGQDSIDGSGGADTIAFGPNVTAHTLATASTVNNFVTGTNRIDLSAFTNTTSSAVSIAAAPNGTANEFGTNAVLMVFNAGSTDVYFDANQDGKLGATDLVIHLLGTSRPTTSDFFFHTNT